MNRIWKRTGIATTITAITAVSVLAFGGVAYADNIQDSIVGDAGITLLAGSSASAAIRVIGNNSGGDADPGCNIDAGDNPLTLTVLTPAGVTATPNPVVLTSCGVDFPVTFSADSAAQSGSATVAVLSAPAGGGSFMNQVDIFINVVQPVSANTRPSVSNSGVTDGATYEIGSAPTATCDIVDAEDGNSSASAVVTGTLQHGLGAQTATCDYTDNGGLSAATATAAYTIVDTGKPTVAYTLDPAAANGTNGWYTTGVVVDFTCADSGSGIASCDGDVTLGEGADQSATGTAIDWAGNTETATASGINVDLTAPTAPAFIGGPAGSYYYGSDPAAPTCAASDALSGLSGCIVTGGGSAVGAHSYTAIATDNAGNTSSSTLAYTVLAWNLKGFYAPVDMGANVWNTVKGGSSVPLKFEVFAGAELTSTAAVKSFTATAVTCPGSSALTDAIELTTTGGTSLRYDSTSGQFIQNWATPKKPGTCAVVTMTTQDGSSISANFMLK